MYALDFGTVTAAGTYSIDVSGPVTAASPSFKIDTGQNVYSEPLANALFQPTQYKWSSASGTPSSNGNLKDRGSIKNIESNIGTLETWEDNASYYISSWTTVKQA